MTAHALAVIIGTFELIVLTVSYVILAARFKKSRFDLRMEEAKILSELDQLEAESASGRNEDVSTSTRREGGQLSYALQSE